MSKTIENQKTLLLAEVKDESCNYTFLQPLPDHDSSKITVKPTTQMHNDLKMCFNTFIPHYGVICEEIKAKDIESFDDGTAKSAKGNELLSRLVVTGVKIKGDEVVLVGHKILSNGECLKMETPGVELGEYPHRTKMQLALDELEAEVFEYHQGKIAPKAQQELDFDEGMDESEENEE